MGFLPSRDSQGVPPPGRQILARIVHSARTWTGDSNFKNKCSQTTLSGMATVIMANGGRSDCRLSRVPRNKPPPV